jgi:hypothetical protein
MIQTMRVSSSWSFAAMACFAAFGALGCKHEEAGLGGATASPGEANARVVSSAVSEAKPEVAPTVGNVQAQGPLLGSCTLPAVACSDYYGDDKTPLKAACSSVGKWSDGPCAKGYVATCTRKETATILNKARTYAPGTTESAKMACDHTPGGVYSVPGS